MKGWVYVISNEAMPSLVKVGFSTKDPELRARELNHTGTPLPYVVEYEMLIEEPHRIEQKAHKLLSSKREAKEWFRCSAEEAIAAIKQVSGTQAISETYKRAERAKAEALHQQELKKQEIRRIQQKEEKDIEDQLRNKETAIREKFEQRIAILFPPRPFWNYWLGGGILAFIAVAVFIPKISDGGAFMLSVMGGGIAGFFLQEYFEKARKQSSSYISLEQQRENELAALRAEGPRVASDTPHKQPEFPAKINQAQDQSFEDNNVPINPSAPHEEQSLQAWLESLPPGGKLTVTLPPISSPDSVSGLEKMFQSLSQGGKITKITLPDGTVIPLPPEK